MPLLFVLFAIWGTLMSFPAFQAIAVGIPLTDSVSTIENGERALRPVWAIALPGISLAAIGLLGALWSYHQYRIPEGEGLGSRD